MKHQHRQIEVAKYGEFNFGAGLLKKEGFSLKKSSDKAQVCLFAVCICQNQVILDNCCGTPFCAATALIHHHSASNFRLIFAGSQPVRKNFDDVTYVLIIFSYP